MKARFAKPDALLLDAGGTLVFLDADAVAAIASAEAITATSAAFAAALPVANASYAQHLASGGSHEDGWTHLMTRLLTATGIADGDAGRLLPALRREHAAFNLWRRVPPELPAALDAVRAAGIRIGVVSN